MPKPKIFISYSVKHYLLDPEVLDALRKRLMPTHLPETDRPFEVLVDKDLKVGEEWEPTLDAWLDGCHAAVFILSSEALASSWVTTEAVLLGKRYDRDGDFLILKILLPDISEPDLNEGILGNARLGRFQSVPVATPLEMAETVYRELEPMIDRLRDTPESLLALRLSELVARKTEPGTTLLDRVAKALEIKLDRGRHPDRCLVLVRFLLRAGLAVLARAAVHLEEQMEPDDLERLLGATHPFFWVPPAAAGRLSLACGPVGTVRAFAINAATPPFTWDAYIRRAFCCEPAWRIVPVDGRVGFNPGEELVERVRETLGLELLDRPDATLARVNRAVRLQEEEDLKRPVLVLIEPAPRDPKVMDRLKSDLPRVTFLLAAEPAAARAGWPLELVVELLRPELDPDDEEDARDRVTMMKKRLRPQRPPAASPGR